MKKLFASLAASVLVIATSALPAAAQTPTSESLPHAPFGAQGTKLRKHLESLQEGATRAYESYGDAMLSHIDELSLSNEQIGQIKRIHQGNQQEIKELGKRLRESQRSLYKLYLNPANDEDAIRAAASDHVATFDTLVDTALRARAEINAVLTPEQFKRLQALMDER